jgi:hypothetical protein
MKKPKLLTSGAVEEPKSFCSDVERITTFHSDWNIILPDKLAYFVKWNRANVYELVVAISD